jgi:outer membrane protein OmpA-like peptidoglycan-associated protein
MTISIPARDHSSLHLDTKRLAAAAALGTIGVTAATAVAILSAGLMTQGRFSSASFASDAPASLGEGAPMVDPAPQAVAAVTATLSAPASPVQKEQSAAPSAATAPENNGACAPLTLNFAIGSDKTSQSSAERLRALDPWLHAHNDGTILVEGHTDGLGLESENLSLSYRRARSVAYFLEHAMHVAPERIVARAHGPYQPIGSLAEAQNRRVTVTVIGAPCPMESSPMENKP